MKEKKLYDAITDINEKFIDEAYKTPVKKRKRGIKKAVIIAACFAAALTAAAFPLINGGITKSSSSPNSSSNAYGASLKNVIYPKSIAFENYGAKAANIKANPVSDSTVNAANKFAYSSAAKIFKSGKNNNYSPLSLYYSLAVLESGAQSTTKDELLKVLGVSNDSLSKECGNLYRNLYFDNKVGKLKIANSLWISNSLNFDSGFSENAAKYFYASSHRVDFNNPKTKNAIADWIKENTNGAISPKIELDSNTLLSIYNTIYFNDEWKTAFLKKDSRSGNFYLSNGTKAQANYICGKFLGPFYKGDNFTRASLELKNGGKMAFILPKKGVNISDLLKNSDSIKTAFESGEKQHGDITWQIPKITFSSKYELNDALKSLGIKSAFSGSADFSGITGEKMLMVSRVHQESFIKLNENGVEAAAFTETEMQEIAVMGQNNTEMLLTRPFIYGIYSENGTLLFVGICENPNEN